MREISADAWTVDCDVLAITTNGTVSNGRNVMGAGIAGEAARRYPSLPSTYAKLIKAFGHHCYLIQPEFLPPAEACPKPLLMFPTKDQVMYGASISRIIKSLAETMNLAAIYGWRDIALPRPGAGLGGLDWKKEVKPALEEFFALNFFHYHNPFIIVSYPGEK